jgi:hypothetical protein
MVLPLVGGDDAGASRRSGRLRTLDAHHRKSDCGCALSHPRSRRRRANGECCLWLEYLIMGSQCRKKLENWERLGRVPHGPSRGCGRLVPTLSRGYPAASNSPSSSSPGRVSIGIRTPCHRHRLRAPPAEQRSHCASFVSPQRFQTCPPRQRLSAGKAGVSPSRAWVDHQ